jgi:phosphatidylinositol 3-kinase
MLYLLQLVQALKFGKTFPSSGEGGPEKSPLAEFLIYRSLYNPMLGNNFFWFLKVECEDKKYGGLYQSIMGHYMSVLRQLPDGETRIDMINRQRALVAALSAISRELRATKETRPKKVILA